MAFLANSPSLCSLLIWDAIHDRECAVELFAEQNPRHFVREGHPRESHRRVGALSNRGGYTQVSTDHVHETAGSPRLAFRDNARKLPGTQLRSALVAQDYEVLLVERREQRRGLAVEHRGLAPLGRRAPSI